MVCVKMIHPQCRGLAFEVSSHLISVRWERVAGMLSGINPTIRNQPCVWALEGKNVHVPLPLTFKSFLLFTEHLLLPWGPPGYLKLLLLFLQISLVVGVNVGIHNVFYQLHKLIMWILCNLEHYQRMNQ